jgi:hypothetical protein
MGFLEFIMMLGGLAAAGAVGVVCGVGLVVWLSGGKSYMRKDERVA